MSEMHEEHGLEVIHVCEDDSEADIIIGFLRSRGIEAGRESDFPHLALPVESDAKIFVNKDDAARAKALIDAQEHKAAEQED